MRKHAYLALAVVCLAVAGVAALPGIVDAQSSSTTLELQAADSSDTDSSTVSFTFTTRENATRAEVTNTYQSRDGVTFQFDEWEAVGGIASGARSSFNVDGQTTYRVTYTVEASSNAEEGSYSVNPEVTVSYSDNKNDRTIPERLSADVEILEPRFGTIFDKSDERTFEPDDGSTLEWEIGVDISNVGDGYMDVRDIDVSGTPRGMSVSVGSYPDEINSGNTGIGVLNVEVNDYIDEGEHSFSVTVTDSLGNSESATVTVEVSKPPVVGTDQRTVDLGEILVGESGTATLTLSERNGYTDIDGVEASVTSDDGQGSISFPGLGSRNIRADGSATQTVEVEVDENAEQGEQLEWDVSFSPNADDGIGTDDVTFTADVLYPPYYEELSMGDSRLVFDEPRSEADEFTDRVTVDLANGGDLPMELQDVSVGVPNNPDIDASVVSGPSTIDPGSTGTITIEVRASSDSPAGGWAIELDLTANEPTTAPGEQTGSVTVTGNVDVEHETELVVDRTTVDAGEVIITDQTDETVTIRERLGYKAVEGFSIRQVAGPREGWLTVTQEPERLNSGQQKPFGVNIQFDTTAELYTTYTWEFAVGGANVNTSTITIQAVPEPVNFAETISELEAAGEEGSGESEAVALEMAAALGELEQLLQEGEGDATRNDITKMVTAARSSLLLVDTAAEAQSLMDEGNFSQAQRPLVQATSAFNTFSVAVEDVSSSEISSRTEEIERSAEAVVSELIERQESHYLEELESEDPTMLEEAQTKRELARVAELSGDEQRATELRTEAQEAFNSYSELISSGNEELIAARQLQDEMDEDVFISPGGFKLFFISSLSTYNAESEKVLDHYDTAIENFEAAGATERADVAATERADIESTYENAYLASIGLGVALGVVLLVFIVWEIRALYRYRLDAEDAVTGDFLLPWAETES